MNLRTKVLRGGAYLALRQGLSLGISLAGMFLLTRVIGPEVYGLYAAALGIYTYLYNLSQWGIDVYLIRREGEVRNEEYHQAFTLLLLLSVIGGLIGFLSLPLIEQWIRLDNFDSITKALLLGLPISMLTIVPLARIERDLNYRLVALIEIAGQMSSYLVSLPLAFQGLGPWSLVSGWWTQQLLTFLLLYRVGKYRPRLYWNLNLAQETLRYGLGYSASIWVWQLRSLVNPLIVGRYAGAEAVGFVALAIRIIEVLSFVKTATWRLSIAALAQLQKDKVRLATAISEGMRLQILALGPFLMGFALISPWLLPLVFGERWLPVLEIYPFIALSYMANAIFNLHSSVLYVLQHNWAVTVFHLVHIILFAGAAFLLLPRIGLGGYGWAEVVALLSYVVIHAYTAKAVNWLDYSLPGAWAFAFTSAFFWQQLRWVSGLGLLAIALWPKSWKTIGKYIKGLRSLNHG